MAMKVFITGATGNLGSRITQQLLKRTNMSVIGSTTLKMKGERLREALGDCPLERL
jgi:nucleoside-diphosphate-sugar epimerase